MPVFQPQLFIAGVGIKDPFAFAAVESYVLNTNFDQLYDPGNSIAAATTNAYAEVTGLGGSAQIPHLLMLWLLTGQLLLIGIPA